MTRNHLALCCLLLLPGLLSGCSSISKGVTEAILERETEDNRQCWISGREFMGLDSLFEVETSQDADTGSPTLLKVLTGYEWPTRGSVSVLGRRYGACDVRALRKTIGWVSSALEYRVPRNDTALEIVGSIQITEHFDCRN